MAMTLLTLESYDYNEDYLKDIEIEHFDESMSNMDCCMYMIAEGERMWNDIMKEMAVKELRHLAENGTEMIYEAADTDNFFTKAINLFKKIAGKFAGFIQKIYANISDFLSKYQRYVKKHKDDIKKGYDLIPADGIEMKTFYKFENLKQPTKKDESGLLAAFEAQAQKDFGLDFVLDANADACRSDKFKNFTDEIKNKESVTTALNIARSVCLDYAGQGEVSAKDFKDEAKKYFFGEKKEGKITNKDIDLDIVISCLENCNQWKRDTKAAYNGTKKALNTVIGKIKKFKKKVEKSDEFREAKLGYAKNMISLYKGFISITNTMRTVQLNAHNARCKQSLTISTKLVALAEKGETKKEEKAGESFTYQFEDGMNFFTSDLL